MIVLPAPASSARRNRNDRLGSCCEIKRRSRRGGDRFDLSGRGPGTGFQVDDPSPCQASWSGLAVLPSVHRRERHTDAFRHPRLSQPEPFSQLLDSGGAIIGDIVACRSHRPLSVRITRKRKMDGSGDIANDILRLLYQRLPNRTVEPLSCDVGHPPETRFEPVGANRAARRGRIPRSPDDLAWRRRNPNRKRPRHPSDAHTSGNSGSSRASPSRRR